MTEEEKAKVASYISHYNYRLSNLVRLYGQETPRCWDFKHEIEYARKYGFQYVKDPKSFLERLRNKRLVLVPESTKILDLLRSDYGHIYKLSPEQFENFICERFDKMGFAVEKVGNTYARDGGIDIIACPRDCAAFPYLLAIQAKHHREASRKTGPAPVKELQAIINCQKFQAGILVTNTTFTPDARWFAKYRPHMVRLRDISDISRWIKNDFMNKEEWREIPETIEIAPGLTIKIPRALNYSE